jgi:plasmid stabilization system protein ParE
MLISWSEPAYDDLAEIISYFAGLDREELGREIVRDIVGLADILIDFPLSGRIGRLPDTRELINSDFPYIVVYGVDANIVQIMRVIHMSRAFPKV